MKSKTSRIELTLIATCLALVLLALLGRGVDKVVIAIVVVQWAHYARIMRSRALQERRKEYIEAAQNLGFPAWRIMLRHLLPNAVSPILVATTLAVGSVILVESVLSFLGLGIQPPMPSWGSIMSVGRNYVGTAWWIATFPGICLFTLVLSVNICGDHLRDRFDPRSLLR